jgi:hypothetical protein
MRHQRYKPLKMISVVESVIADIDMHAAMIAVMGAKTAVEQRAKHICDLRPNGAPERQRGRLRGVLRPRYGPVMLRMPHSDRPRDAHRLAGG